MGEQEGGGSAACWVPSVRQLPPTDETAASCNAMAYAARRPRLLMARQLRLPKTRRQHRDWALIPKCAQYAPEVPEESSRVLPGSGSIARAGARFTDSALLIKDGIAKQPGDKQGLARWIAHSRSGLLLRIYPRLLVGSGDVSSSCALLSPEAKSAL